MMIKKVSLGILSLLAALFGCSCSSSASFSSAYPQPPVVGPLPADPFAKSLRSAENTNTSGAMAGGWVGNIGSLIGGGDYLTNVGATLAGAALGGSLATQATNRDLKYLMNRTSATDFNHFLSAQKRAATTYRNYSGQAVAYSRQIKTSPVPAGRETEYRNHAKATQEYFRGNVGEIDERLKRLMKYRAINSRPQRAGQLMGVESDLRGSKARIESAIHLLK